MCQNSWQKQPTNNRPALSPFEAARPFDLAATDQGDADTRDMQGGHFISHFSDFRPVSSIPEGRSAGEDTLTRFCCLIDYSVTHANDPSPGFSSGKAILSSLALAFRVY